MEYHIRLTQPLADLRPIEAALQAIDPVAQVDIDKPKQNLRVAAYIEAAELVTVLSEAGYPVLPQQIVQLPSICCGGCGG
jgi:copper chaperone CopZ